MTKLGTPIGAAPKSRDRDRGVGVGRRAVRPADRRLLDRLAVVLDLAALGAELVVVLVLLALALTEGVVVVGGVELAAAVAAARAAALGRGGRRVGAFRDGRVGRRGRIRRDVGSAGTVGVVGVVGAGATSVSSPSVGPEQPGSPRSTRPSPSSSAVLAQAGRTSWRRPRGSAGDVDGDAVGAATWAPTAPAASTAASTPSASVITRRFLIPRAPAGDVDRRTGLRRGDLLQEQAKPIHMVSGMQRTTVAATRSPSRSCRLLVPQILATPSAAGGCA